MKISFTLFLTVLGIDGINALGTLTIRPDYDFQVGTFNPETDLPSIKDVLVNAVIPPPISSSSSEGIPPNSAPNLSLDGIQKELKEEDEQRAIITNSQNRTAPKDEPPSLLDQIRKGKELKKVEIQLKAQTSGGTGGFNINLVYKAQEGAGTNSDNGGKNTENNEAVNQGEWSDTE